jgi:hypothetical protein
MSEMRVKIMRKVIFFVHTMKWDGICMCYYSECLYTADTYEEAEYFCSIYDGEEETVYIQKAYKLSEKSTT